jgi:mono/diheme cytochrome c family protein
MVVMDPSVGAVHLDSADPNGVLGDGILYSTSSTRDGVAGVWFLPFDSESGHPTGTSRQIVQYLGDDYPAVTGVATGPDGIYFSPLLPGSEGDSPILRLEHADSPHPIAIEPPQAELFTEFGCIGCHQRGGGGGDEGPSLDFLEKENRERVLAMIESEGFEELLRRLDQRTDEPYLSTRPARAAVLRASGLERLEAYVKHKVLEPRFANPGAQMPQLGLTEDQAAAVASELASPWQIRVFEAGSAVRRLVPVPPTRVGDTIAGGIVVGTAMGFLVGVLWILRTVVKRFRSRPTRSKSARRPDQLSSN